MELKRKLGDGSVATVKTCDYCNPDGDPNNKWLLPTHFAVALGLEPGTTVLRGVVVDGDATGWTLDDDGLDVCPVCKHERAAIQSDSVASGSLDIAQALSLVRGDE